MTNQLHTSSHHYSLRQSTIAVSAVSLRENPEVKKSRRTILPLEETPSLIVESQDMRLIDLEKSALKSHLRIQNYWIDMLIERVASTQFSRGKTHLQGSQAPFGWQAAHFSLAPATQDHLTKDVIISVVEKGITPVRSKPFLQARISMTSPEGKLLNDKHTDPIFVRNFVMNRLPKEAEASSLYGTRFSLFRNATFENPDESNQFDSLLEKSVKPILKRLQMQHFDGDIDEDAATLELVEWLLNYYKSSIKNNQQRLEQLSEFFAIQNRLTQFEDQYSDTIELPEEQFQEYISDALQLLKCKAFLLSRLKGSSRCHAIKWARKDYYYLITLVRSASKGSSYASLETLFYKNVRHFANRSRSSEDELRQKYEFFIQEAKAQIDGIQVFTDPCTIPGLKTAIFGICVDGKRLPPTESELREQVYSIFKLATPFKNKIPSQLFNNDNDTRITSAAKRLRFDENQDPLIDSPVYYDTRMTSAAKRLCFDEADLYPSL